MSKIIRKYNYILFIIGFFLSISASQAQEGLPDFTELVGERSPAVVNISTTQTVSRGERRPPQDRPDLPDGHPFQDFLDKFFKDREQQQQQAPPPQFEARSLGSGVIISKDGFILTNNHVVEDASEIVVRLSDRREFVAELVGADESSDLAVLHIEAKNLPVASIGKSSKLQVGEWVLAIGSPFGFEHSVTAGIVSAKGRSLPNENYVPFIQTDVAINPGNSGGPLFNLEGEVVGINSHIYSRTGGFQGVSFAIPIELAMDVVSQLRETGEVARGWLGVLIQDVTRELAESFGMETPEGALVSQVMPDSPAARGGMKVGDVIVQFNGRDVPSSGALPPIVGRTAIGEPAPVKVIRDGEAQTLEITVGELPDQAELLAKGDPSDKPGKVDQLGLSVDALDDETAEALDLDPQEGGVVVTEVEDDGPAAAAGVRSGDVITMVNRQPVSGVAEFRRLVDGLDTGKTVPLLVRREDGPRFLALTPPQ